MKATIKKITPRTPEVVAAHKAWLDSYRAAFAKWNASHSSEDRTAFYAIKASAPVGLWMASK